MKPDTSTAKQIAALQKQVNELLAWKKKKETQQLSFPLDTASINALNNTLKVSKFDRINVRDIYFTATMTKPTVAGQMRFFNDGAVQQFQGNTTFTVFTGSFDSTAV